MDDLPIKLTLPQNKIKMPFDEIEFHEWTTWVHAVPRYRGKSTFELDMEIKNFLGSRKNIVKNHFL